MDINRSLIKSEWEKSQCGNFPKKVDIFDFSIVVYRGVFDPSFFDSTIFFGNALPFQEGLKFLEIGCGTGAISIHSVKKGCSTAVGIDVSRAAVENSRLNARLNDVIDKTQFTVRNMKEVEDFVDFDLIFWNHPWVYADSDDSNVVGQLMDTGYQGLRHYLRLASQTNSKVFLGFGDTGDLELLNKVCSLYGVNLHEIATATSKTHNPCKYFLFEVGSDRVTQTEPPAVLV
jgi:SAM-dependent methyltransferase